MSQPRLTIGMAALDDFDGVYFTITSLMLHHREAMDECDFVVVDNNPGSRQGQQLKEWIEQSVPRGVYQAFPGRIGTAQARNEVFRHGEGEYVLCLDCHVLIVPGAIRRLLDFYGAHRACRDLLSGPLLFDSGGVAATHQRPEWCQGSWGVWAVDERGLSPDGPPFEIWQQTMQLFSCRRDAWVGFHPDFRGFGGCESYIMEKFRKRGSRVLCLPWLRWAHRFRRPLGTPYRVSRDDQLRNYEIGFRELGIDVEPARRHFAELNRRRPTGNVHGNAGSLARSGSQSLAVFGEDELGSVRMRGASLAAHLKCSLSSSQSIEAGQHWDTAVAVKGCSSGLRDHVERLIYDPLDSFWEVEAGTRADKYWRQKYEALRFDDVLATSPACAAVMRDSLPESVQVHLVPHHSDPRIDETWRNADGPVVYAGQSAFIASGMDRIRRACELVGKPFVVGNSCDVLKGASLALALRLPPHDTELNRHCKPQIKIANALAGSIPVVTTDCPAATSLYPDIPRVPVDFSAEELAAAMRQAMEQPRPSPIIRVDNYLTAVSRVLGIPALVVFTGVFGGDAVLRDPLERHAGVQYLCVTDNPRLTSRVWTIRAVRRSRHPLMQSLAHKILAHEHLDCDASLWIDSEKVLRSLNGVFEGMSADVAFPQHGSRHCIYAEAEHCRMTRRGDPGLIDRSVARFRAEGHPDGYGLWDSGVILRRHCESTRKLNCEWWREVSEGTPRDQISLPVVIRRLAAQFATLQPGVPAVHSDP